MIFHTFDEFLKHFYPRKWKRDKERQMSAREFGEYLAQKAMDRLREVLRNG